MNIRCGVDLSEAERGEITAMLGGGSHPARKLKRAQTLLAADAGVGDEAIAASVRVGGSTACRTKRRFVEGNLDLALSKAARPGAARKLSGRKAALLVAIDAHRPWRHVKATDRRTAQDFALCMRDLADTRHPEAEMIRVVLDNLSTHTAGALYETFPAHGAHRILQRLEFHRTPKHAS